MKKLNFGCGTDIREGWDNIDIQESHELTSSFDFNKFPYPIKDDAYDYIYSKNVLEHLESPEKTLNELWRISNPSAIIEISVPYYNNKGTYSSLEHRHFFNDTAFKELEKQSKEINKKNRFRIIKIRLKPTWAGRLIIIPWIRNKISLFIGGLISQVEVKIEVIK